MHVLKFLSSQKHLTSNERYSEKNGFNKFMVKILENTCLGVGSCDT